MERREISVTPPTEERSCARRALFPPGQAPACCAECKARAAASKARAELDNPRRDAPSIQS